MWIYTWSVGWSLPFILFDSCGDSPMYPSIDNCNVVLMPALTWCIMHNCRKQFMLWNGSSVDANCTCIIRTYSEQFNIKMVSCTWKLYGRCEKKGVRICMPIDSNFPEFGEQACYRLECILRILRMANTDTKVLTLNFASLCLLRIFSACNDFRYAWASDICDSSWMCYLASVI
jgi:hypothetical protein